MEDKLFWIWLSLVFPYGSPKPAQILSQVSSPEEFYRMEREEMKRLGFLTEKDINSSKRISLERARFILDDCQKHHIQIVTYGDETFPKRLKLIYGPPTVLYYAGDISGLDESVVITMVGTRQPDEYSFSVAEYLAHEMASAGAIIVSGCAVGLDSAAHWGALEAGGRTVGVLGCGLDVNYPEASHELKKQILRRGGALITEYPPGIDCSPYVFRVRNRILAGLALGVVVTQAPERSGSLITAEHALEQGKEVFCVPPYSIFDPQFFGVIRYLRDGAIPVFSPEDVLGMYSGAYANSLDVTKMKGDYLARKKLTGKQGQIQKPMMPKPEPAPEPAHIPEDARQKFEALASGLDETKKAVYHALDFEPRSANELAMAANRKIGLVLAALTELELLGIAESFSGQRFALSKK